MQRGNICEAQRESRAFKSLPTTIARALIARALIAIDHEHGTFEHDRCGS